MKADKIKYFIRHLIRYGIFMGFRIYLNKFQRGTFRIIAGNTNNYVYLREKSSDIETYDRIFLKEEYFVNKSSDKEFIIIDLGANIGLSAIYFNSLYPNSKIYCIEPEKSNFELLKKNVENSKNISVLNAAIWFEKTNLYIDYENTDSFDGFRVKMSPNNSMIQAYSIVDILSLYKLNHIDILKIDIEGAEIELFSQNTDNWIPLCKMIVIEIHDWFRNGCSKAFFAAILKYNFKLRHRGEHLIVDILN